jgi:hypothetical protein
MIEKANADSIVTKYIVLVPTHDDLSVKVIEAYSMKTASLRSVEAIFCEEKERPKVMAKELRYLGIF